MKWFLSLLLITCLQAHAQDVAPSAELSVETPEAFTSGSASSEAAAVSSTAEIPVAGAATEQSPSAMPGDQGSLKNLKETEIPVQLESVKKAQAHESPFLRIFLSLGIVGVLGAGAFYFLRKYRFSNDSKSQATQIKILTQHYLGPKKSLAIVRVAGESVLIGITDHNINMIKSLSLLDEDIPEETPKEFQTVFAKKTKTEPTIEETPENKDDFSISGIKDFVSVKLKNMRSFE